MIAGMASLGIYPAFGRYLTPETKARVLQEWEGAKSRIRPADDPGGHGWVDPDVIPLCDALNNLPGVCTLQSCAGHGDSAAYLWLWLDEQNSRQFDHWGYVLTHMSGIEVVTRKYTDWGQEITAVEFDSRFNQACKSLLSFFVALTATSGSSRPGLLPDTHCQARR